MTSIGAIEALTPTATMHAVISSLSPVKKGHTSNYSDGTLVDDSGSIRFVRFSPMQLQTLKRKRKPIRLPNCEIKQARRGTKMEVMLKSSTGVGSSMHKSSLHQCSTLTV